MKPIKRKGTKIEYDGSANRLAILSVSTQKGTVAEYLLFLIQKLHGVYKHIYIVSSYSFDQYNRQRMQQYADTIIEDVAGDDFKHWKKALELLRRDNQLASFEDLVLINDSIYGPFVSLNEVFEKMDAAMVDFWGITRHQAMPGTTDFIQTYFIDFKIKKTLHDLLLFFDSMDSVANREMALSHFLEAKGHSSAVFVRTDDIENRDPRLAESFFMFYPYFLVKERECPFVSRYMFSLDDKIMSLYGSENQIPFFLEYIDDKYPSEYIYKDLICQYNMYDLVHRLKLNFILNENIQHRKQKLRRRVAAFVYLYYEKDFLLYIDRLRVLPKEISIYIYTDTESKVNALRRMTYENKVRAKVHKVDGRGREWATFLNEVSQVSGQYDYGVFLHDKSFHSNEFPTQAYAFRDLLWDNLIPSEEGVKQIINIFECKEHIGILLPPIVKHGSYFKYYMNFWTSNYKNTVELAHELDIKTELITEEVTPISIGGMFWFRVDALQKVFTNNMGRNIFCEEPMPADGTLNHSLERIIPYVAQDAGYYSGIVSTQRYLQIDWMIQTHMVRVLGRNLKEIPDFLCELQ